MKRVLLVVIDGWTPRVFEPALDRGELPTFRALADRGWLALDCVSIFPSITPAATASIVTGEYPAGHGISGMSWWNPETQDVSYFGDDVRTVLRRGAGSFLRDFLQRLNGESLKAPTLFQLVEREQKRAACFNHLIFRGDHPHEVSHPWILQLLPSIGAGVTVHGPSWLCLGDFVSSTGRVANVDAPGGMFNRFGLDDEGTESFLRDIPEVGKLPDFTVAYFADYDFDSHDEGPQSAAPTLHRLDARLGRILDRWGGVDRVLEQLAIVMVADHGHSEVGQNGGAAIELEGILGGYRCADPATGWQDAAELLVCPNMRAAEVFHRDGSPAYVRRLAERLLTDARVDHVLWRDSEDDTRTEFHVLTADRGELRFRRHSGSGGAVDEYGGGWRLSGDHRALDLQVENGRIRDGLYPNALERIACGVTFPRVGRVFATARVGHEFAATGQSVHHGAGSHGTLHEDDSRVPLLVAGLGGLPPMRVTPRIVDAAAICSQILEIEFAWRPGDTRAAPAG